MFSSITLLEDDITSDTDELASSAGNLERNKE
jgi:hypothetical protein